MLHCSTCDSDYAETLAMCPECRIEDHEVVRCPRCSTEYGGGPGCPACGLLREASSCALHPDRKALGQCVVCGRAVCEECSDPDRRAFLCKAHAEVRVTDGWAEVYTTTSSVEAQLLRDTLRADGIDAQILSQRDLMFSVELGELSIVRVLVPVWMYSEAREAVKSHLEGLPEVVTCPSCGLEVELESTECPACGGTLS